MTSTPVPVITIDGPSGTGKGTLSSQLAEALGFATLDSGSLYRALAWTVIRDKIDITKQDALQRCINAAKIELVNDRLMCDGDDITGQIRNPTISMMASKISANTLVRKRLLQLQRDQAKLPGLVTDGRDMGTVVFPEAMIKIYLTASPEACAKRRYKQLKAKGNDVNLREIEEEMITRDRQDSERAESPLKPADDAITIDTSDMGIQETFDKVLALIRSRL
ncbi:MAG: cytidylate kinase [Coxiella sp. (in: Bacteria)]|nr:MAG: cytidylate kinase [Coxiella sp. (in: g-proteobacteria)]